MDEALGGANNNKTNDDDAVRVHLIVSDFTGRVHVTLEADLDEDNDEDVKLLTCAEDHVEVSVFAPWPPHYANTKHKRACFSLKLPQTKFLLQLIACALTVVTCVALYVVYFLNVPRGHQMHFPCESGEHVIPTCAFDDGTQCGWDSRDSYDIPIAAVETTTDVTTTLNGAANSEHVVALQAAEELCRADSDWCALDEACANDGRCSCMIECTMMQTCWHLCTHPSKDSEREACSFDDIVHHTCPCLDSCLGHNALVPRCTKHCETSRTMADYLSCLRSCVSYGDFDGDDGVGGGTRVGKETNTINNQTLRADITGPSLNRSVSTSVHAMYGTRALSVMCRGRAWSDWPAWARRTFLVDRALRQYAKILLPYVWLLWLVLRLRIRPAGMTPYRAGVVHVMFLVFDPVVFGGFFLYQILQHGEVQTDHCCSCHDSSGEDGGASYFIAWGALGVGYAIAFKVLMLAWTIGSAYSEELGVYWFAKALGVCVLFAIVLNDEVILGMAHAQLMLLFYSRGSVVMQSVFLSIVHPLFWLPMRAVAMSAAINWPGGKEDDGTREAWDNVLHEPEHEVDSEREPATWVEMRTEASEGAPLASISERKHGHDHPGLPWKGYLAALPLLVTMQMAQSQKMDLLELVAKTPLDSSTTLRLVLPCAAVALGSFLGKTWQLGLACAPRPSEALKRAPYLLVHAIVRHYVGMQPIVHTHLFQNVLLATMVNDVASVLNAAITLCLFNDRVGVHGGNQHKTYTFGFYDADGASTPPTPPAAPLLPWAIDDGDDEQAASSLPETSRVLSICGFMILFELIPIVAVICAHASKGISLGKRWALFQPYTYAILLTTTVALVGTRIERLWRRYLEQVYYCNPCTKGVALPRASLHQDAATGAYGSDSFEPLELVRLGLRWLCFDQEEEEEAT